MRIFIILVGVFLSFPTVAKKENFEDYLNHGMPRAFLGESEGGRYTWVVSSSFGEAKYAHDGRWIVDRDAGEYYLELQMRESLPVFGEVDVDHDFEDVSKLKVDRDKDKIVLHFSNCWDLKFAMIKGEEIPKPIEDWDDLASFEAARDEIYRHYKHSITVKGSEFKKEIDLYRASSSGSKWEVCR